MKRVITLPNGRACSLPSYCAGWRKIKTLAPDALIGNWSDFPTEAGAVLRDLHFGMHERINRHIPGFGRGRKWDERHPTDLRRGAQRVNDYRHAASSIRSTGSRHPSSRAGSDGITTATGCRSCCTTHGGSADGDRGHRAGRDRLDARR